MPNNDPQEPLSHLRIHMFAPARARRRIVALCVAVAVVMSACVSTDTSPARGQQAAKPNIIYFLVDDLSAELLDYTDTIAGLAEGGTSFTNYYVSNSLCCPSRASMFTGLFPHNTGVETNTSSDGGGYPAFAKIQDRTYAPELRDRGYRTGYLGKYINQYQVEKDYVVPKGWDEWHVGGQGAYSEFNYDMTRYIRDENTGKQITKATDEYMVDELGDRSVEFLTRSREHAPGKPFFLQVAPFSPHSRVSRNGKEPLFPPAMRDRPKDDWQEGEFPHGDCGGPDCAGIDVADLPAFNEPDIADKPSWVRNLPSITNPPNCGSGTNPPCLLTELRTDFRDRIRMMQALDDMVGQVLGALTQEEKQNTYIVFSSDNGFHLGQHRLPRGKTTAYDHDIRVPLLIHRPAGGRDIVNDQIVQNVDIYATLVDIANGGQGGPADRDGRSLLPLINGQQPDDWRNAALVEHVRPGSTASDPDSEPLTGGVAPTYQALRTGSDLLVRYDTGPNGEIEYYDTDADPDQLDNDPDNARVDELTGPLDELVRCGQETQPDCWTAAHVD
jgi:N-acetylglucosamine-6-sulfatase